MIQVKFIDVLLLLKGSLFRVIQES